METTAAIRLDDMELELVIQSLRRASDAETYRGNVFRARLIDSLERKITKEQIRFQDKNVALLEEKYGIKEEKPALQS